MNEIRFVFPQFDRPDGTTVTPFLTTIEEYERLPQLSDASLQEIGCARWEDIDGKALWLFPHEWYDTIPYGLDVVDIFGRVESFEQGKTDNDKRFCSLPYGFIKDI